MALKTYIGARYAPKYMGEWNNQTEYGALSVVSVNEDANYISKKVVPVGTEITNEEYWLKVASWNAQVQQYNHNVNEYRHSVEEYKLAVEAFYADTIHAYDNKSAMIADTSLKDGDTLITCGEDTIGDNKGSFWQVVSNSDETTVQLVNGLYAKPFTFDIYDFNNKFDERFDTKFNKSFPQAFNSTYNKRTNDLSNRNIICFGDSWGINDPSHYTGWPSTLSTLTGATVTNYCVSGAGYTKNSNLSFLTQVNNATADENATDVIIFGGYNDINSSNATNIVPVLNAIKTKYPNATHWCAMNGGEAQVSKTTATNLKAWFNRLLNASLTANFKFMTNLFYRATTLPINDYSYVGHPNNDGINIYTKVMANYLYGGNGEFNDPLFAYTLNSELFSKGPAFNASINSSEAAFALGSGSYFFKTAQSNIVHIKLATSTTAPLYNSLNEYSNTIFTNIFGNDGKQYIGIYEIHIINNSVYLTGATNVPSSVTVGHFDVPYLYWRSSIYGM